MLEIPTSKNFMRNQRAVCGTSVPCFVCGKPITKAKQTRFIHVVEGGSHAVAVDEAYDNELADMGLQAVGPECRLLFPKGYVFERVAREGSQ